MSNQISEANLFTSEIPTLDYKLASLGRTFQEVGFVHLQRGEGPLSDASFLAIQGIVEREWKLSDAHCFIERQNNIEIASFIEDRPNTFPTSKSPRAHEILSHITSRDVSHFITDLIGGPDPLFFRRCQALTLIKGKCLDAHVDVSANPTYKAAFILGIADEYLGGNFVLIDKQGVSHKKHLKMGEMIILDSTVVHEIERVTSGRRITLAGFYGTNYARNPKNPFASASAMHKMFEEGT